MVSCSVLTIASWPAYRFFRRQVRWSGIPISWRIFHSLLWSTVKCFGIVSKAKVDIFLELSCFFDNPMDVGNLISGCSAFSKSSLNIWKFMVHVLLKCDVENFEHYFASVWDECNCVVVWTFFGIAFLWNWNENWPFPVLWPLLIYLSEKKCLAIPWKRELELDFFIWQNTMNSKNADNIRTEKRDC